MEYKIAYNSDLIISNPTELSTFSIFYDKIMLPYTTDDGYVLKMVKKKGRSGLPANASWFELTEVCHNPIPIFNTGTAIWEAKYKALFDEGVLARVEKGPVRTESYTEWKELSLLLLNSRSTRVVIDQFDHIFVPRSLIDNLLRDDVSYPGIFTIRKGGSLREVYKAAEALHTFNYLMPRLSRLNPEEILEIRSKVKNLREGFSLHLQRLSTKMDVALQEQAPWEEITRIARNVIETELIPDYREFRRFLGGRKVGFWARVLNMAGQVIQVNALPWKSSSWSKLAMTAGALVAGEIKEEKERASNANLAYRLMHVCEG